MKIGILGSGQLGWMIILEGRRLGHRFLVMDSAKGPASEIADKSYSNESYREFLRECDVVTYEFENIPMEILEAASDEGKLLPSIDAIRIKKKRSTEKDYLAGKGFRVAPYHVCGTFDEALDRAASFGDAVIKTSSEGYDGKGQFRVRHGQYTGERPVDQEFVVEKFVPFDYEASVIVSRDITGTTYCYRPSLNFNYAGKLRYSYSPLRGRKMEEIALRLVKELDYVGTMGIEFFRDGADYMINEIAPRVHNTGHHTLRGFSVSQFEQHVLAVTGSEIIKPEQFVPSGVVNIIGNWPDNEAEKRIISMGGTTIYNYFKQARKGRKLGHVNVCSLSFSALSEKIRETDRILYGNKADLFF
ncbi:MAG: 5-(carboxyamino)imidazole ribonucleotide synthase [Candidatus Thermoplasmatota archaeon]|nr:5-(carboxyamino)imidazole ribonucleotide synthase [Candidatus Thermoplasmatota archaeon]MCL5731586.1 5-(carboxyamino)imidazole ribonucleotide synthase [Candidatus Thermoplasmatota archaeon]